LGLFIPRYFVHFGEKYVSSAILCKKLLKIKKYFKKPIDFFGQKMYNISTSVGRGSFFV